MTTQEILSGLWVIAGLVIIEGLLSVDNVLGIAALANELPEQQQKKAIRLGLAGAYLFRVLALLVASWLISNTWVRWLGAGYLVWLMCSHLTRHGIPDEEGKVKAIRATFAGVLLQIGLMDLSLSIDNVIAAVGLAPEDASGNVVMWPIYTGVGIAILALQAIAPHAVKLLRRYPILEPTAFVLIGYVGGILLYEETVVLARKHTEALSPFLQNIIAAQPEHVQPYVKFAGILLLIWVALLYSADGSVRRAIRPVIILSYPLMKGFAGAVNLLFLPFKALFTAFKPKPADVVD